MFDVAGRVPYLALMKRDVGRPLRDAPAERFRTRAGLVVQLLTFAVPIAGQRVEGEARRLVSRCRASTPKPSRSMNCWMRGCALELHALRDVLARIGETEVRAQIAPRTRAVRAQVRGLARGRAAGDGDRVDAVGLVVVVVERETAAECRAVAGRTAAARAPGTTPGPRRRGCAGRPRHSRRACVPGTRARAAQRVVEPAVDVTGHEDRVVVAVAQTSTLPEGSNDGFAVMTLSAPPTTFLPSSTPCGPRMTSMRSRS